MTEALQLWKTIAGKGDGAPDDPKSLTCGRHVSIVCHCLLINHSIAGFLIYGFFYV